MASVISASALIGTLLFQVQQFKATSQLQRQANEDTQWREMLAHLKSNEGTESALGLSLIKSFLDSDTYKQQARELEALKLGGTSDPFIFQNSIKVMFERTNWDNLNDIVGISKLQVRSYNRANHEVERLQKQDKGVISAQFEQRRDPVLFKDNYETNIVTISEGLVQFLRDAVHHPRPLGSKVNLTDAALWDQDLSNMDFSGAILLTWIAGC